MLCVVECFDLVCSRLVSTRCRCARWVVLLRFSRSVAMMRREESRKATRVIYREIIGIHMDLAFDLSRPWRAGCFAREYCAFVT